MSGLSDRQVNAVIAARAAQVKAREAAEKAAALAVFAEAGEALFSNIVATVPLTDNEERTSAYHSVSKLPYVSEEGREYSVSVIMTDITRKAEKTAELHAEALAFLATEEGTALVEAGV